MSVVDTITGLTRPSATRAPTATGDPFAPRGLAKVLTHLIAAVCALVTMFPLYAMVVLSLRRPGAIEFPASLVPWDLSGESFARIFATPEVWRWMVNTLVYALVSVVLILLISAMAGYAFAKRRFKGREVMFWSLVSMLMVPYQVTLIPLFILVARSGGVDTYWGLILPGLANVQAVFLMRQFIMGIPDDLIEAARIDGCGDWRIFARIVLPLCKPILATLGIFVFLWHWNDFLWPLLVGQDPAMRTLTTGIASLQAEQIPLSQVFAGSVVAFVPIFLAYLVGQRYITDNAVAVGIKG
ncbi:MULTISPECIES: carbohydrate ABC transporter permease [Actinoalloteichus]|uniref:Carbohydrate ABC transporter membrane protein 2, CUT1 family n=1 Tax=Actinoalloteichus fjordicus TaxID=1612552 RepID=A0AAC9LF82_9PSEU|nr:MULTISPECIES: carbohydrate ABC transporter permease [Actinoalloteichus]APU15774.1 carbohydrate ABC transporter membrane protein 2, CUT1 family [Actinoalloteichus fjordicus]APU21834.1 carbohydrate ABC transporter membrane protein 2, CUT1 family [Actinoalloteichus sp. GBA129-24]